MPLKNGRLTRQERAFIQHMGRTGEQGYSAYKAGYANEDMAGSRLMKNPVIRAEVYREAENVLVGRLLPLALAAHEMLLIDKAVPAGARVQAVKLVYDRTLGATSEEDPDKSPSEMTAAELQRSIAKAQAELKARPEGAKDVTPAPSMIIEPDSPGGSVFE